MAKRCLSLVSVIACLDVGFFDTIIVQQTRRTVAAAFRNDSGDHPPAALPRHMRAT
jgi:hypothetical protein